MQLARINTNSLALRDQGSSKNEKLLHAATIEGTDLFSIDKPIQGNKLVFWNKVVMANGIQFFSGGGGYILTPNVLKKRSGICNCNNVKK